MLLIAQLSQAGQTLLPTESLGECKHGNSRSTAPRRICLPTALNELTAGLREAGRLDVQHLSDRDSVNGSTCNACLVLRGS